MKSIEVVEYISARIVTTEGRTEQQNINIKYVYGPENCEQEDEKMKFYEVIQVTVDKILNKNKIIFIEHLHASICNSIILGAKQKFNGNIQN